MSITRRRRLRTGTSPWSPAELKALRTRVTLPRGRVDLLIVGAGISGALLAHTLTGAGLRPVIVDRRTAGHGSTLASTALLQSEIDTPLVHLSRRLGRRPAERAWQRSHRAVSDLRNLVRTSGIGTLVSRPSLYLPGNVLDTQGLRRETRARQRAGLPAEFLASRALRSGFGINKPGAILSHHNATADPANLTAGLLRQALQSGASLVGDAEVTDVQRGRRGFTVLLADGRTVDARRVVFCTGYELPKIVPRAGHHIVSTFAMATAPQPARLWPEQALIWEAADPYLYLRTTPDGRVICGGEDEPFADADARDRLMPAKTRTLTRKLHALLPDIDHQPTLRWCGSFGVSRTGLPIVGQIPGWPGCYAVLGFGGNGITFSMLAAGLLLSALTRRREPDAKLFAFP